MSLGLISGYGSGSESDGEDTETAAESKTESAIETPAEAEVMTSSLHERLKCLAEATLPGSSALFLPPPPPPSHTHPPPVEPLPNPLKQKKGKTKLRGMGRREAEMLATAQWTDITTEAVDGASKPQFEYNTPLPFNPESETGGAGGEEGGGKKESAEYDYMSYVAEYQNYMAGARQLLEGQAKGAADQAKAAESEQAGPSSALDPDYVSPNMDEWNAYMAKYSEWYNQYGGQAAGVAAPAAPPQIRQKTFEELVEQDRQLEEYFSTEAPNEYNSQRDAFKSSFRGTRLYRMRNGENYNKKHFNQLSQGAKAFASLYPKQKSVFEDKDAYVADKDLPENQDPKSNKQKKKDKWFEGMKKSGKGCKKCGFVFCRCYGWEFKPSHMK